MSELLDQFTEYISDKKHLKSIDKGLFILLFKTFVRFINDKGYEICYKGKNNVQR